MKTNASIQQNYAHISVLEDYQQFGGVLFGRDYNIVPIPYYGRDPMAMFGPTFKCD